MRRDRFKNTSKEERAKELINVICPKCGYQNHYFYAKKYGRCNLCKTTIDSDYFKKMILRTIRRLNIGFLWVFLIIAFVFELLFIISYYNLYKFRKCYDNNFRFTYCKKYEKY